MKEFYESFWEQDRLNKLKEQNHNTEKAIYIATHSYIISDNKTNSQNPEVQSSNTSDTRDDYENEHKKTQELDVKPKEYDDLIGF